MSAVSMCAQLVAKADLRFVEGAFKLMREQWSYRPALSPHQFLQPVRHVPL